MLGCFLAVSLMTMPAVKLPVWTKARLAGYVVSRGDIGVYDEARNFYLTRTIECDGADITVTLTRDRKVVSSMGFKVPSYPSSEGSLELKMKPLSSLATSMGVAIGDNESKVRAIVGSPNKVTVDGPKRQFRTMSYTATVKQKDESTEYVHKYTFKEGRLIEIQFGRYSG